MFNRKEVQVMKRCDLVVKVSKNTNYNVEIVDTILKGITDEIISLLKKSEPVSIHGLGKFVARSYGRRKCYNPITKSIEMLEPSIQPAFIAGPKFRKEINGKN